MYIPSAKQGELLHFGCLIRRLPREGVSGAVPACDFAREEVVQFIMTSTGRPLELSLCVHLYDDGQKASHYGLFGSAHGRLVSHSFGQSERAPLVHGAT